MSEVDVSVIVCTYNRAQMLGEALRSLLPLETNGLFRYEILVIDNASTDETPQVVQEIANASTVPIRLVHEPKGGVSFARNRGVVEAHGDWIAFFDDDQLAEPDWLYHLVKLARDEDALCTGGAVLLQFQNDTSRELGSMVRVMLGEVATASSRDYGRKFAPGTGNLMLHRRVFEMVGNFRTDLEEAGEDTDLYRSIRAHGIRGCYTPEAVVHHVTPEYRLEKKYLRWTALRIGGHVARRERYDWGLPLFLLVALVRFAQAWLLFAPRVLIARLRADDETLLNAMCWWWHGQGYLRSAKKFLFPRWLSRSPFIGDLAFRNERQMQSES